MEFSVERGFDSKLHELLSQRTEVFLGLDILSKFSSERLESFLIHLYSHNGILLKRLRSRGPLHKWIYRLG